MEHNAHVMTYFKKVFQKLESLGHLHADVSTDIWALNSVCMPAINKRIDQFKECCGNLLENVQV